MANTVASKIDSRRVLLVEDSSVTKDLIELVLTQAGHHVVAVATGASALTALKAEDFDVVLTDFHLPDFSGLEVVRKFLGDQGERPRPVFVAITGDTRGLLADKVNCEIFDRVVPKPLDIDVVCELVLEPAPARQMPAPNRTGTNEFSADLGLAVLKWPVNNGPMPAPGLLGIDAIVIQEVVNLQELWAVRGANLLPVLDQTGKLGASADIDMARANVHDVTSIRLLVDQFHNRQLELHGDLISSKDPSDRLLARIHVSGGTLEPRRAHDHDGLIAWNTICDPSDMTPLIAKLAAEKLIRTTFFERLHHCPACQSAKLIVREECPACQSADLFDQSYLHHFRCATQRPESDFAQGDDLVCPKCRRKLQHFGRDYDRPGVMTCCNACSGTTSEPQIAFVCARCDTRTTGEAAPLRDVHMVHITEKGQSYLRNGSSMYGVAQRALRFGDFPIELVIALNLAAADFNLSQKPFTLGAIHYQGLDVVRQESGARHAWDARQLWRETFRQNLTQDVVVATGETSDFVLMPARRPEKAQPQTDAARAIADATVRDDLRAALRLFGPEELLQ